MGTLYEYLDWRGDLSFQEAPLNEVDNLIFSLISYLDFMGIVPRTQGESSVPIRAAVNAVLSRNPDMKKFTMGVMVPKEILLLARAIKDTRRFRTVEMRAHVNVINTEKETQFSATTFFPGDGRMMVTFRGTDDTIIGWKENFNMSFLPVVPAQQSAVEYLNDAASHFDGPIYVNGHSKGGNLAVYASVHCETAVRKRILQVWNNDGPGFRQDLLTCEPYLEMRPNIRTLVPQTAVVGMLLEHDENYTVIKSAQAGLMQHNGLTWEVMGSSFIHLSDVDEESKRLDKTLNDWIRTMTPEQCEQFTESIYQLLSSDNALTLTDLVSLKNKWISKSKSLDPHVHKTIQQTLSCLISMAAQNRLGEIIPKSTSETKTKQK